MKCLHKDSEHIHFFLIDRNLLMPLNFLNVTSILLLHIKLNPLNISEISLNKILPKQMDFFISYFSTDSPSIFLIIIPSFKLRFLLFLTPYLLHGGYKMMCSLCYLGPFLTIGLHRI